MHGPRACQQVCAYPGSSLAHKWAKRGYAAVRVAHKREGQIAHPGPQPIPGRALTWFLDLDQKEDRRALKRYAEEHSPDDLWTSPSCRVFCGMQRINEIQSGRRGRRPSGEKEAMHLRSFCRTLHRAQRARGGRSHHEQSVALRWPSETRDMFLLPRPCFPPPHRTRGGHALRCHVAMPV